MPGELIEPGESTGDPIQNPRRVGDVFCPFYEITFTNNRGEISVRRDYVSVANPVATFSLVDFLSTPAAEPSTVSTPASAPDEQQIIETAIKSIASVTVESVAGSPFKITIDITPTYEDGVRLLESGVITFQTTVTARWGYVTSTGETTDSGYHHFTVNEPKASFGEDMRITIVAHDFASNNAQRRTTAKQWSRTLYPTDLRILSKICSKAGYTLSASRLIFNTTINSRASAKTFTGDDGSTPQFSTDWQFFKSICRRHGVAFYVAGREVILFDPLNPPPSANDVVYTFKWRTKLVGTHDIPVYSVAGTILPSAFLPPGGASGVFACIVDNTTGRVTYQHKDAKNLPATREASATSQQNGSSAQQEKAINASRPYRNYVETLPGNHTIIVDPTRDADEFGSIINLAGRDLTGVSGAVADTMVREASFFSNPRVKIRCPGVVDLYPGMLVRLVGTGKIYDYTYTVHSVKHMLGTNGYDMEVDLMRQGTKMSQNVPNAEDQKLQVVPVPTDGAGGSPTTTDENGSSPVRRRPRRVS